MIGSICYCIRGVRSIYGLCQGLVASSSYLLWQAYWGVCDNDSSENRIACCVRFGRGMGIGTLAVTSLADMEINPSIKRLSS